MAISFSTSSVCTSAHRRCVSSGWKGKGGEMMGRRREKALGNHFSSFPPSSLMHHMFAGTLAGKNWWLDRRAPFLLPSPVAIHAGECTTKGVTNLSLFSLFHGSGSISDGSSSDRPYRQCMRSVCLASGVANIFNISCLERTFQLLVTFQQI